MTTPTLPAPDGDRPHPVRHPLTVRERRRLQPPRAAQALVALAVSNLPPQHRSRYTLEFLGEMYGTPRASQVAYAGSLFLHSWHLGAALSEPDRDLEEAPMRKSLRCRLGMHRYVRKTNPEAVGAFKAYLECARCGHFHDIGFQIGN